MFIAAVLAIREMVADVGMREAHSTVTLELMLQAHLSCDTRVARESRKGSSVPL